MGSERQTLHIEEIAEAMGDARSARTSRMPITPNLELVVQGKNFKAAHLIGRINAMLTLKSGVITKKPMFEDLIFPKVGTIGKVGILSECEGYQHYLLSTNTMRLRVDSTKAYSIRLLLLRHQRP